MFVADTNNHCVRVISIARAAVYTLAGSSGVAGIDSRHLYYPQALLLHNELPWLFISDRKSIRKYWLTSGYLQFMLPVVINLI